MIKVQNNIAARVPISTFLRGLAPSSLGDLSWTDPALGVQNAAWWPEDDQTPALPVGHVYGAESLEIDAARQVVITRRAIVPMTPEQRRHAADAQARELMDRVSALRWQRETGGIDLGAVHVDTALADQNRITSVIANAALAGVESVDFKAASGWVSLTLPELQAIAAAIARHVQACFTAERRHHEAIQVLAEAGDLAALAAYDATVGWSA